MADVDEAVVAMVCDEKRMTDVDEAVDVMVVIRISAWSTFDEAVVPWLPNKIDPHGRP